MAPGVGNHCPAFCMDSWPVHIQTHDLPRLWEREARQHQDQAVCRPWEGNQSCPTPTANHQPRCWSSPMRWCLAAGSHLTGARSPSSTKNREPLSGRARRTLEALAKDLCGTAVGLTDPCGVHPESGGASPTVAESARDGAQVDASGEQLGR